MPEDENNFEETLRAMAREVGESLEQALDRFDVENLAGRFGIDPETAKDWIGGAESWLRAQAEQAGAEQPRADQPRAEEPRPPRPQQPHAKQARGEADLPDAAPHPLDLPTQEQGLALAALDSGRWTVEPGTSALALHAQGPGPSDALGLVRELHVRDWIDTEGEITRAGRHALSRWLGSASRH